MTREPAGLLAAAMAVRFKAPFLVVVALACLVTALVRLAAEPTAAQAAHDHADGPSATASADVSRVTRYHSVTEFSMPNASLRGEAGLDVGAQVAVGHGLGHQVGGESVELASALECGMLVGVLPRTRSSNVT